MPFDREEGYRVFKSLNWSEEDIEKMVNYLTEIHKYEKSGDNVIHLSFDGDVLSEEEILGFDEKLKQFKFEFSYQDESKVPKAQLIVEDPPVAYITMSEFIFNSLVYPMAYDLIKTIVLTAYRRLKKARGGQPEYVGDNPKMKIFVKKKVTKKSKKTTTTREYIIESSMTEEAVIKKLNQILKKKKS